MADISNPEIAAPDIVAPKEALLAVSNDLSKHFSGDKVSISLRYYHRKSECWSEWRERELKDLSAIIDKLRHLTPTQLKQGGGPYFTSHKGPAKGAGFKRPDDLSEDIPFFEIGLNKKSRIHGFILGSVFFLVWLDRDRKSVV